MSEKLAGTAITSVGDSDIQILLDIWVDYWICIDAVT